jgi:hypothetical protein
MQDDLGMLPRPRHGCRRGCLVAAGVALVLAIVIALSDGLWLVFLFTGHEVLDGLFQPIMNVPGVKGRVIELQTGQPVQGVRVTRAVIAWAFPSGLESAAQGELWRSRAATVTDTNGAFSFPPVRFVRGFHMMQWQTYREGWMPGRGRIWKDRSTGNQFKEMANQETYPWVVGECTRQGGSLVLTIRVSRPTMDGVAYPKNVYRSVRVNGTDKYEERLEPPPEPWGVYFDRLRWLALDGGLEKAEVGRQALRHAGAHGPVGEDGVLPLLEIADWVSKGSACAQIVEAVLSYCGENTTSDRCGSLGPQDGARYLERKCGVMRDPNRSP